MVPTAANASEPVDAWEPGRLAEGMSVREWSWLGVWDDFRNYLIAVA